MKNEGGREAGNGKCSKDVLDRGDRCQFIFLWSRRIFCNVFPYSVCKAQLIGDWYETKGARNTTSLLIIRQFYWRTDVPCANSTGGRNTKKKLLAHCVWSGLPLGGGGHRCANILAHVTSVYVTHKKFITVWCASPIFKPIAYKLWFTSRKRKYFEEKTTAILKSKQTSIATVRNHLRTLASFPTLIIFHWSLPLTKFLLMCKRY